MIPRAMALRQAGYCERCEWMTAEQVLRYLMISRRTLDRRAIPCTKLGSSVRCHRADVESYKRRTQQRKTTWLYLSQSGT